MNTLNAKLLLAAAVSLALSSGAVYADDKDQAGPVVNARQEAQIWTTYALSPYLRATDLSISVVDGKATLTGNVAEDVQKDLAEAIAEGVNGIKKVDNQIKVEADYKAPNRSNTRGYADVVDDAWSKYTEGMDTKVSTNNGKVELTGSVTSAEAKKHAETLAKNTKGVRSVDNRIVISDKAANGKSYSKTSAEGGSVIADSWITTKVKSTFMYSSNVNSSDISVNTDKGIVTLAGNVDSGAEQALAIELAQNIRGVKSVNAKQLIF